MSIRARLCSGASWSSWHWSRRWISALDQCAAIGQAEQGVEEGDVAQAGDQLHVVGTQGDVGAEDLEEVAVDFAERPGGIHVGGEARIVVAAEA